MGESQHTRLTETKQHLYRVKIGTHQPSTGMDDTTQLYMGNHQSTKPRVPLQRANAERDRKYMKWVDRQYCTRDEPTTRTRNAEHRKSEEGIASTQHGDPTTNMVGAQHLHVLPAPRLQIQPRHGEDNPPQYNETAQPRQPHDEHAPEAARKGSRVHAVGEQQTRYTGNN